VLFLSPIIIPQILALDHDEGLTTAVEYGAYGFALKNSLIYLHCMRNHHIAEGLFYV
jgi:hypothetical protein